MKSPRRALAAATLALLAACSSGDNGDNAGATPTTAKKDVENYTRSATFKFKSTGGITTSFEGPGEIHILSADFKDIGKSITIGNDVPLAGLDGWNVEVFVTLADSDGQGRIEIKPASAGGGSGTLSNSIYAAIFKGQRGAATEGARFDKLTVPCRGEVSDSGGRGHVRCESVGESDGARSVTFEYTWSATGPRRGIPAAPATSTTSTPATTVP